jgi:penicillin-binding protein 2
MLIFDQLRKDDPQLRFIAAVTFSGLLILLAGLWWVQLVSGRHYQEKLDSQSIRTVRIPSVRGKILDREGRAFAENQPNYSVVMYLEALRKSYQANYTNRYSQATNILMHQRLQRQTELGRKLTPQEIKQFALTKQLIAQMQQSARNEVTSNLFASLSARLQTKVEFIPQDFQKKYEQARELPITIIPSLTPPQLASFEEQSTSLPALDLAVGSGRVYPNGQVAAHLVGYLVHNNNSSEGEEPVYSYRLPDYVGIAGLEGLYDTELRGIGGEKAVVVNYLGYKQSETITSPAEPGRNVVTTIDMDIQKAAEDALNAAQANVRGAVVVMDAQNGDVLAMASAPGFDPNHRIHPDPATKQEEDERWSDPAVGLQRNRALYENYHPGSIFKPVVAMAALEKNAFDPHASFHSLGYLMVGRRRIRDTAGPGEFDFNRAMAKSSNPYFITLGLKPGVIDKMISIGEHLHLGEVTGVMPGQEARGNFPSHRRINASWFDGDTANLSIGQGEIDVTPIQMAVMTTAIANGGKVFWPRLVSRIESADGSNPPELVPEGRVRDNLGVSARTLHTLYEGMLADTEDPEGTGRLLHISGWRIAGKTGTAEVERNGGKDRSAQDTWFVSFGPYSSKEKPRYVVVATVEGGASGGLTCVPIAHNVYLALQQKDAQLQHRPFAGGRPLAEIK